MVRVHVWVGDLWLSAASGYKGDDLQYLEPLSFVPKYMPALGAAVPVPERRGSSDGWVDAFELELPPDHSSDATRRERSRGGGEAEHLVDQQPGTGSHAQGKQSGGEGLKTEL